MSPALRVRPLYLGVGLASGSALAVQVAYTRIFSITLWHHFAYLVVGIALLGFGAAGSFLTARGGALRPEDGPLEAALARRARFAALGTFASIAFSATVRCDALALTQNPAVPAALVLLILLATLPFFGTGVVLATALAGLSGRAGPVYASDLLGAGLGAVAAVPALGAIGAPGVIFAAAATTGLAAAAFALDAGWKERVKSAVLAGALLAAAIGLRDDRPWVHPAPSKELSVVLDAMNLSVEWSRWTPLGRIDVTEPVTTPPAFGGAAGAASAVPWTTRGVFQDGAAPTFLFEGRRDPATIPFVRHWLGAAPWVARGAQDEDPGKREGGRALVIGVGGGIDLLTALAHGADAVTAVDVNPATTSLLTDVYRDFTGNLPAHGGVRIENAEGRAFVAGSRERYDVIQLSGVDTYAALASGAYSVAEAYLYTVEAFEDYFDHLAPGGCVAIQRFALDPPRETLRLATTAAEAMRRRGDEEPWRRIFILRGGLWAATLVWESPVPPGEIERLRGFAAREGFPVAFDPQVPGSTPFDLALRGPRADRAAYIASYRYRVEPPVDDAPFFFNYFRWADLPALRHLRAGPVYTTEIPIGHGVLAVLSLGTAALGAFGILSPLRRLPRPGGQRRRRPLLYFAAIGLAYLFVEIALIQRLTLFLGHPTYALTVVLAGLLVSSGVGASLSRRWVERGLLRFLPFLLAGAVLALILATRLLLPRLLGLPFAGRVAVAFGLLLPLGLGMGVPFPSGLDRLQGPARSLLPWAFAVNAFFTVIAASLSTLIAMEIGFTPLLGIAAGIYLVAFAAFPVRAPAEGSDLTDRSRPSPTTSETAGTSTATLGDPTASATTE